MDAIACQRAGVAGRRAAGHRADRGADGGALAAAPRADACASTATPPASAPPRRAIDRALPLLKPGRSFRFALRHRRQGPRRRAARTGRGGAEGASWPRPRPSSRRCSCRERDLEPLDTPERRAGLKAPPARRRRAPSPTRTSPSAYREELLPALRRPVRPRRSRPRRPGRERPWRHGAATPRRPAYEDAPLTAGGPRGGRTLCARARAAAGRLGQGGARRSGLARRRIWRRFEAARVRRSGAG